jgi:hypothetical protein
MKCNREPKWVSQMFRGCSGDTCMDAVDMGKHAQIQKQAKSKKQAGAELTA